MDLQLLSGSPFGTQDIPESVTITLEDYATCARYSPSGRLVAAGRHDGWGTVWDLDTQGVLRSLEGHTKAVTSVSWSRNSRYLLTSSRDWNCVLWDLEEADRVVTIRFTCPVTGASLNPHTSKIAVAVLSSGQCFLIDMRHGVQRYELLDTPPPPEEPASESTTAEKMTDEAAAEIPVLPTTPKKPKERVKITVARFSPDGLEVYAGTSAGEVLVFNARTKLLIFREKLSGSSTIRNLEFDSSGRYFAIASNDRVVRTFRIQPSPSTGEPTFELLHKLQDSVNRTPWNAVTWSKNGDYICGGASQKAGHMMYVWDRDTGRLEKILQGPREPLLDVHWHPDRPAIASVSSGGLVHIWSIVTQERWGAFAAGFEELEENMVYEEKEDEFDIEDEEVLKRRKEREEDQDVDIDGGMDEDTYVAPIAVDISDVQRAADIDWLEESPDDDTVSYYPPVYPEPPEANY